MSTPIYLLNNGSEKVEINRLDFQHDMFLRTTGGDLIPKELSNYLAKLSAPKVLDVGTGTGVWLRALAKTLPQTATLEGLDFDTSKFPETLPANISLSFGDILKPFPDELHGQFDLVHIRLLFYALKADQWVPAAKNVMSLLKPGGVLMWEELGYSTYLVLPPSKAWSRYIDIDVRAGIKFGRDPWHQLNLRRYVAEAGFQEVEERSFQSVATDDPALMGLVAAGLTNIALQSLNGLVSKGGAEGMRTVEDATKLVEDIKYDFAHGHEVSSGMTWVWGQKPV